MPRVFAYGVEEFYKSAYEKASTKSIYDLPGRSLLMILYYLACYLTILVVVYVFQRWKQEQREDVCNPPHRYKAKNHNAPPSSHKHTPEMGDLLNL